MPKKYEILTFKNGDFTLNVTADEGRENVWLSQAEISLLFQLSLDTLIIF